MDEMSAYRSVVKNEGISDKLGFFIANEAMRKMSWSSQPELLLEELKVETEASWDSTHRTYIATYTIFSDRNRKYKVEVNIYKQEGKWAVGTVRLEHLTGAVFYSTILINWTDEWIRPCIVFSQFMNTKP